jgi:hypothetical protein
MLKKIFSVLLALVLSLSSLTAFAAVKNADLAIDQTGQGLGDISGYVNTMFAAGDTLYLTTYHSKMYTWSPETGEIGDIGFENLWNYHYFGHEGSVLCLNTDDGSIHILNTAEGKATVDKEALISLDWSVIRPAGADEMDFYVQVFAAFVADNMLYVQTNNPDSNDWSERTLYRFDMETGKGETLYAGRDMLSLCPYKDGKLLIFRFDQDKYYMSSGQDTSSLPEITVFDPQSKAYADKLLSLGEDAMDFGGLAYDAASDTLYLCGNGSVMFKTAGGELTPLTYIPASYIQSDAAALLIGGTHYVISNSQSIFIRSLDPDDKPSQLLKVQGVQFDWEGREGYLAFTKKHPEVAVISNTNDWFSSAEGVFQDMKTATASDIYAIGQMDVLEALINKDYCVDLSGNAALLAAIKEMYPHMSSAFLKDAKVYAVPYGAYNQGLWGYSPSILKEIGLTEADLPTNLSEFMDFITDWADMYGMDYPDFELLDHQYSKWRELLIQTVFLQQISYCSNEGIPMTFDTPEVLALLKKIDSMASVFAQLDPSQETLEGGQSWSSDDPLTALLTMDFQMLSRDFRVNADYSPLEMNYIQDSPMLTAMQLQVLIANPSSPNLEMAAEFLAEMAANMNPTLKITINPNYNEPVENPYAEQNIIYAKESLEQTQKSLDEAKAEDKKEMESRLEMAQQWLEQAEWEKYDISPAQIEAYRLVAQNMVPVSGGYSMIGTSENLLNLYSRYLEGQIPTDQFVQEMEKVLKKMHSENR